MSPTSFDDLASKHPEHRIALRKLAEWMRGHGSGRIIDPTRLAKEVREVDPIELALALTLLVKIGFLRQVYKVTTPAGILTEAEFDDPTQIPPKLPDRFHHYFDTSESDVVPVFRMVA